MSKTCDGCTRKLPGDRYLCASCTAEVATALADLPTLIDELTTTAYRQDRLAAPSRSTGERPLPFKTKAALHLADVRLHLWSLLNVTPTVSGRSPSYVSDAYLCSLLARDLPQRVKRDPHASALLVLIGDAGAITDLIDLPKSFRYLGQCDDCQAELYANREAKVWACHTADCDRTYEVEARMAELIERARNVVATVPTIARALTSLELPVTEERIRKWKERGLLTPRSTVGRQAHYLVGDVLDLLHRERVRKVK